MVFRRARLAGLLLVAGAFVGGCTSSASDSAESAAVAPAPANAGGGMGDSAGAKAQYTPPAPNQPAGQPQPQISQPGVDRKLVRTASVDLTAGKISDAADTVRRAAVGLGGYSGQEQISDESAGLTVFVPSDKLDAALDRIAAAGKVKNRTQAAQDVTEEVVDVDSRVQTQRASLARVRALLDRATGISEIVELEGEVTRREADLESLLKRQQALAGSVALSTITVRISLDGAAPPPAGDDGESVLGALSTGWHAFIATGGFVLRLIGMVLPFAVALGLLIYLYRWLVRPTRSKEPDTEQPEELAAEPATEGV
ncbi:DUF4349 domain-containing protein [Actinokineospora inagensis]|uniref:DUF4349 domain-containing protein n=1 Tax=Actinokineospora inagensis TaxID=103730 RepID=UPI0003FCA2EC|nr:DUF4349 domain-containing protein [Actinokineospora inagensis]